MTSYWDIVPRGIWRVVDIVDAINAVADPESTYILDEAHHRVHVFGPGHKAVWIDLDAVEANSSKARVVQFWRLLDKSD